MIVLRTIVVVSALALAGPLTAQEMREVETVKGAVSIPAEPERIVVLNPAVAGYVYALGLDILAVTESYRSVTEDGFTQAWADEARASGSEVLPWDFEGYNFEQILAYEPDLIIAGGAGRPGFLANEAYDQLSAIAPTLFVETTLPNWEAELDFLATALGREEEAEAAMEVYEQRVAEVREAITLPEQPTIFVYATEPGAAPYFVPEDTPTPQLFAQVGFEPDPLGERYPDFERASTGDSVRVSHELAPEILSAPTMILFPWTPASPGAEEFSDDPLLGRIPAVANGYVYEMPDYIYRFDYYGALATLDAIEETFGQ